MVKRARDTIKLSRGRVIKINLVGKKLPAGQMEEFYALQRKLMKNDLEHMDRVMALGIARAPLIAVPGGYVGFPTDSREYYPRERGYD